MEVTFNVLVGLGVVLTLQIAVIVLGAKAGEKHEDDVKYSAPEYRTPAKRWIAIVNSTITLSCFGGLLFIVALIAFLMESVPDFNRETMMKCETIGGEFSKRLDACYKNGIKINFSDKEVEYEHSEEEDNA